MIYSKLEKCWYSEDKFIINIFNDLKIKYGKYIEYDLKQNDSVKHFFCFANFALLLS